MSYLRRKLTRTTKHTCGGPKFGKRAPLGACPRCDELHQGAAPVKGWGAIKLEQEARFRAALEKHDCNKAGCGPVCTFGDW
jgi:hypothetical protein